MSTRFERTEWACSEVLSDGEKPKAPLLSDPAITLVAEPPDGAGDGSPQPNVVVVTWGELLEAAVGQFWVASWDTPHEALERNWGTDLVTVEEWAKLLYRYKRWMLIARRSFFERRTGKGRDQQRDEERVVLLELPKAV